MELKVISCISLAEEGYKMLAAKFKIPEHPQAPKDLCKISGKIIRLAFLFSLSSLQTAVNPYKIML
jgi:hypothetical protein